MIITPSSSNSLLPLTTDVSPLGPPSISSASSHLLTPQHQVDLGFPFSAFLPALGGYGDSPSGLTNQTLPPQYADLDLDQLLRELEHDVAVAAAEAPAPLQVPLDFTQPLVTPLEKEHL
jgi:hypothetical protein